MLLEAESGGLTLDQTFTPPKCMGLSRFTADAQQRCEVLTKNPIDKSSGDLRRTNPLLRELTTGNRAEKSNTNRKQEHKLAEVLNDNLHKEVLRTEPLLELPGERNLKTILGYPEQSPCSCLAEMIYYPARPTTYVFWDVQEIVKLGLPPPDGKVRYITLKDSLIVAWFRKDLMIGEKVSHPQKRSSIHCIFRM